MRVWLVGLLALSPALFLPAPVRADSPAVWLDLTGCPRLPTEEVRRMFAADLGAQDAGDDESAGTTVVVACDGSRVRLTAVDRLSRKQVERLIDTHAVEVDAEPRLVAIAASELVLASWAELALNPEPRVSPEGPASDPSERAAARNVAAQSISEAAARDGAAGERARRDRSAAARDEEEDQPLLRVLAVASTRQMFGVPGRLWGGGVRFGHDLPGVVAWSSDVLYEAGTLGNGVEVGAAMGSGNVFLRYQWLTLTGRFGAGLRFGLTTSGEGNATRSTIAPWGWPMAVTSVTWQAVPGFAVDLRAEGGYALLPVASRDPGGRIRGPWLALQFGFGAAF